MVGARAKPLFEAEAKERQAEGGKAKGKANLPEASRGQSRDKAASSVNVSGRSVEAAAAVLKRAAPELIAAVEAGHIAVSAAADLLDRTPAAQAEIVRRVESGGAKSVTEARRQVKREEIAAGGSPAGRLHRVGPTASGEAGRRQVRASLPSCHRALPPRVEPGRDAPGLVREAGADKHQGGPEAQELMQP
ncbi:MAG: hypothetical protein ACYC8T_32080 [Myxococcaceae bacterium]